MNIRLLTGAVITALLSLGSASEASANGFKYWQLPAPIQGPWQVTITPFTCDTGEVHTASAVLLLMTFNAGGTLAEANSASRFAAGQRSGGLGYWERTGWNSYNAHVQAFIEFDAGPYVRGQQSIDQSIEMQDANHWTGTGPVTFRNAAGDQVPPSGCAQTVAVRMP